MEKIIIQYSPNDDWAEVELYRWQTGHLPNGNIEEEFDIKKGLLGMARAIELGDEKNLPSPFNVSSVLRYCAKYMNCEGF